MKRLALCVIQLYSFRYFPGCSQCSGQYWCWIGPQFPGERLAGEYIWLLIALFASAMLYIPLYFWTKGFWSVDDENNFHCSNPDQRLEYIQRRADFRLLL